MRLVSLIDLRGFATSENKITSAECTLLLLILNAFNFLNLWRAVTAGDVEEESCDGDPDPDPGGAGSFPRSALALFGGAVVELLSWSASSSLVLYSLIHAFFNLCT